MEINKINQRVLINSKSNKYTGYSKEEDTFERSRNEDKGIYKPVVFHRKKQANPGENNNISQTEIQKETKSLNIIYTNDIHGAIVPEKFDKELNAYTGGMAYMGTVIKKLKKETEGKNLLLDAGDWALGSCESELTGGKTIIDVMNNLGYDGAEIGNHEFDWGQEPLKEMIDRADFPVMGANITKNDGTLMEGLTPYIIKEINGIKVGILGLISQDTSETVDPGNIKGINFKNSRKTVEKYLPEIKKNGAELIIVLSHEGLKDDVRLATETGGIDIIVGGHSHTSIGKAAKINNTIIVQAGSNSVKVGNLHINIDSSSKKILSFENSLVTVNNNQLTPDSEIEEIINPVIEQTGNGLSTVIGKTEVDLDRNKIVESVMGNVLTDAIRESTGSDIAVENSGSIRKGIRKGNITVKSIHDVLPFNTYLVTMELTGKDIKDLMEISATTQDNLQVSGLTMTVDYSQPAGKRVSDIKVQNKTLEHEKNYRVSTEDFLALGFTEYTPFHRGKNISVGEATIEALKSYIKHHSPITSDIARIEGRIKFTLS